MADVDGDEVQALARLARLHLEPEEVDRFAGQLAGILRYIDQLQAITVDHVSEYVAPSREAPLREDIPGALLDRSEVLNAVALVVDNKVAVPPFFEG